jgi:DNA-binding response OmpR family regulator
LSASEAEQRRSAASGCDDFLPKPVRIEDLLAKLERHLGLTWVRPTTEAPKSLGTVLQGSAVGLNRPPDEVLTPLADLTESGRIRNLLEATQRLEAQGDAFVPFFAHLRGLAQRFQIKALRDLLRRAAP